MKMPWETIIEVGGNLIDELFTSDDERNEAKLKLLALKQQGKLQMAETKLSAIISESQSKDPWTSRARPSFMYVIYVLILSSIPMGVLSAFSPDTAIAITDGFKAWLGAIPSDMLALFGVGYLGYAGARTVEKKNGVSK